MAFLRALHYCSLLCLSVLLISCSPSQEEGISPVPLISEANELVVLVLNSPTTLYIDANDNYAGLEYDLIKRFAEMNQLKIRFVIVKNYQEMQKKILAKEAHLAVGMVKDYLAPTLVFGAAYQDISLALIYPATLSEKAALEAVRVEKKPVAVPVQYIPYLEDWQKNLTTPITIQQVINEDNETLINAVSEGKLAFAIVDSLSFNVASNYYPHVLSYPIANSQAKLAWALRAQDPELQEKVTRFFIEIQKDQTLRYVQTLYYGHINRLQAVDTKAFLRRRKTLLPRYKDFFWQAEKATGIDWRLLAALAYQESHWDPLATSPYGVRGMMMLTTDTAQRLGVKDRLDPLQSIMGGAQYIKKLRALFPPEVNEVDRNGLTLAAYNVGIGHLNDARKIATWQKKNPNAWADVKTTLPLLRQYEYFSKTRHGYARGGEPVIFVESLYTYYDILVRFEPPLKAASPALVDGIAVINPNNRQLGINSQLQTAEIASSH
jgi:membrane-bound lytic murein transglycosylase F